MGWLAPETFLSDSHSPLHEALTLFFFGGGTTVQAVRFPLGAAEAQDLAGGVLYKGAPQQRCSVRAAGVTPTAYGCCCRRRGESREMG